MLCGVCMYWCIDVLMYWCIDVLMYWCMYGFMYWFMYWCMYACMHVCMCLSVCLYACMHACMYVKESKWWSHSFNFNNCTFEIYKIYDSATTGFHPAWKPTESNGKVILQYPAIHFRYQIPSEWVAMFMPFPLGIGRISIVWIILQDPFLGFPPSTQTAPRTAPNSLNPPGIWSWSGGA